ncbi:MAG: electron transfer flavoprotein subunit alpha/FixB family protein [Flavobacteriaceae bacterium]|jgi:electron transfer flavoprotein alpha subunit|nr:electron transfer flavoprotein subunit alpha/FixB family protein [Flavobacteriaceae bacterium]MDG1962475.1 electron transfer flavoprotein subunit alpha/FixB family protein [Flavobacteriaceae bacterium]
MSVLVYAESDQGIIKKIAQELISYGRALADQLGTTLYVAVMADVGTQNLAQYGAQQIVHIEHEALQSFSADAFAQAIAQSAKSVEAEVVLVSSSANSRYLAPMLAVGLDAAYVPNCTQLPLSTSPFQVTHSVYTNKAEATTEMTSAVKLIGLAKNAFGVSHFEGTAQTTSLTPDLNPSKCHVSATDRATDKVMIADAEIVVSAGRGLKGPENWHLIEDLAEVLGAATACSKPVSDLGWRPHSEHVGQTGKPVASNLYIAIGISGAIQHLAGINSSKVKVVINTDPEAPFFKAADYGIVGDAFDVVPELIEKLKQFKTLNA